MNYGRTLAEVFDELLNVMKMQNEAIKKLIQALLQAGAVCDEEMAEEAIRKAEELTEGL